MPLKASKLATARKPASLDRWSTAEGVGLGADKVSIHRSCHKGNKLTIVSAFASILFPLPRCRVGFS